MTLTAHAIVGAGIVSAMPAHPLLGICVAFASHFVLDAIPHYDYQIRSSSINPKIGAPMKFDRTLLLDFFSIGSDFVLGVLLALFLFATPATLWLIATAAFAGTLPDALQFAYILSRREPLVSLQRFHRWTHTRIRLREHPIFGVASQVLFLVVFVTIERAFINF